MLSLALTGCMRVLVPATSKVTVLFELLYWMSTRSTSTVAAPSLQLERPLVSSMSWPRAVVESARAQAAWRDHLEVSLIALVSIFANRRIEMTPPLGFDYSE